MRRHLLACQGARDGHCATGRTAGRPPVSAVGKMPYPIQFRRERVAEMRAGVSAKVIAERDGLRKATVEGWLQSANCSAKRAEQVEVETRQLLANKGMLF